MPQILPFQQITLVSSLSRQEIEQRLGKQTRSNQEILQLEQSGKIGYLVRRSTQDFVFRGLIREGCFYLIPYRPYPEHFQPRLVGHIEETSLGSIIFLRFKLLAGTVFFAALSALIFLIVAAVFLFLQKNVWTALITLLLFAGSYAVMLLNFQQKARIAQQLFNEVINEA